MWGGMISFKLLVDVATRSGFYFFHIVGIVKSCVLDRVRGPRGSALIFVCWIGISDQGGLKCCPNKEKSEERYCLEVLDVLL